MPRQSRIDTTGALQHIIARGIERRKIFEDDQDRHDFPKKPGLDPGTNGNGVFCLVIDVQSFSSVVENRYGSNIYGDATATDRPRHPV